MTDAEWDEAIDKAIAHGCVPENQCWDECVEVWIDEIKGRA